MGNHIRPDGEFRSVIVLGGGVLGLTAALEIATSSRIKAHVHILARDLPTSHEALRSQQWASPWAGFNWCSFAKSGDVATQRRDRITYDAWMDMLKQRELPADVMDLLPFTHYLDPNLAKGGASKAGWWFENHIADFKSHVASSDTASTSQGQDRATLTYSSFCASAPRYLAHLVSRLLDLPNVRIHPATPTFDSLASALSHPAVAHLDPQNSILINATGMGSRYLADVADLDVYAIRGQTVLVRAGPAFMRRNRCVIDADRPGVHPTYVIPRASSGEVILGGTFGEHDWNRQPSEQDTERILRDCARLCPDLIDDGDGSDGNGVSATAATSDTDRWKKLYKQIISVNVGLRPARKGDATRVELDSVQQRTLDGQSVRRAVVHCYGAGKAGYQGSIGIAKEVEELVHAHFAKGEHAVSSKL
ncbi:unnamed protein product [Parajaminaea phylloscopi]